MELRPLGTLSIYTDLDRMFTLGSTPAGTRMIQEIGAAELVGDRVTATMVGVVAADWLAIGADGLANFDIRMVLETDDGALLYFNFQAKVDWSGGIGTGTIYAVAQFETGDDRYRWLNVIQVVGQGTVGSGGAGPTVTYDFYELV